MPPGAFDLPNVFDKALKLQPSSPTKNTHNHFNHPMFTRPKSGELLNESVVRSSSPTRKANKENTPPSSTRLAKTLGPNPAAAAISRQEQYQTRDLDSVQRRQVPMRGLTPEELEKLQDPRVKRLVNVTQLCTVPRELFLSGLPADSAQISSIIILTSLATSTIAKPAIPSFASPIPTPPRPRWRSMSRPC
jgi:hypothetical protein